MILFLAELAIQAIAIALIVVATWTIAEIDFAKKHQIPLTFRRPPEKVQDSAGYLLMASLVLFALGVLL